MAKKVPEDVVGLSDMGRGLKLSFVKGHDILGEPGKDDPPAAQRPLAEEPSTAVPQPPVTSEIDGRDGLDPTRYGDWEKNGRCIDF
ncbi:DUF1674 domain-containing protein [uncultured Luteimonas sp.]|uniref:DUF1674 domain-containing protein n=1 Tax=uncultured Luteimonas sp. TaxID=453144 RepID=UPI002610C72A|nr:DUF1674 domain-containing protein [uncultured Luteimonas sp.]